MSLARTTSIIACIVGCVALATGALATLRYKLEAGQTVEALAELHYGDARWAPAIRAMNKLGEVEQPAVGTILKIPGPTIHTALAGETLRSVAERFLAGDGGDAMLAEVNELAPSSALVVGQVLTVPAEIEVETRDRSAEELATLYLGDANLGARIRRYNGVADGARLPATTHIPLVGLAPRPAPVVAPPTPVVIDSAPLSAPVSAPDLALPAPLVLAPPSTPAPPSSPAASAAPALDLTVPVTGVRATLAGFSHAIHEPLAIGQQRVGCLACHAPAADGASATAPTTAACLVCHKVADDMPAALRQGRETRLPLPMNHKTHVGEGKQECVTCHRIEPARALGVATNGHQACAVCHQAGEQKPYVAGDTIGAHCTGCHGAVEEARVDTARTRYLRAHLLRAEGRAGDVSFTHATHASFTPGGRPAREPAIACTTCHDGAADAVLKEHIEKPTMQGCIECHRQASGLGLLAPESCAGCHLHQRVGVMPKNDLVTKKPLDHTALFRRRHAEAYARAPAMCASCHTGTDGSSGTRCDTCHLTMRPRDHTAGFRDNVHGRAAQIDQARCTTCHRAERCESCHRETPKSHFPLATWTEKARHASRARLDLGSCLVCHRFELTCARCHSAAGR